MTRSFHTTGRTFMGMTEVPDPIAPTITGLLTGHLRLVDTNIVKLTPTTNMYAIVWSWEYDRY